jgi:hypothetical protein
MYALIENGEITRINITLPISIGNASIPKGATGLESFGLYPIVGDEPSHTDRERIAGPQYVFDGAQVNRVFTVEAIPDEEVAGQVRAARNEKLAASDWTQGKDIPDNVSSAWAVYRQALRDVPSQTGFPWSVQWPTQPE